VFQFGDRIKTTRQPRGIFLSTNPEMPPDIILGESIVDQLLRLPRLERHLRLMNELRERLVARGFPRVAPAQRDAS
jgi:hypothetical protein